MSKRGLYQTSTNKPWWSSVLPSIRQRIVISPTIYFNLFPWSLLATSIEMCNSKRDTTHYHHPKMGILGWWWWICSHPWVYHNEPITKWLNSNSSPVILCLFDRSPLAPPFINQRGIWLIMNFPHNPNKVCISPLASVPSKFDTLKQYP